MKANNPELAHLADPFFCGDCEQITAEAPSGYRVAAVSMCSKHRADRDANLAAARAANPEVDAVHRMIAAASR